MREESDGGGVGGSTSYQIEGQPSLGLRFRLEQILEEKTVILGYANDLYVAGARMAFIDPSGVGMIQVVDRETEEVLPSLMMAMVALHEQRRTMPLKKKSVNWAKEGF